FRSALHEDQAQYFANVHNVDLAAGSPIGSGHGILNPNNLRICLEYLKENDPDYPVIVDAGVGTASDVAIAMELGCDGVLLNTGIDRKSTRLNSSHVKISYAVFCLKKKNIPTVV